MFKRIILQIAMLSALTPYAQTIFAMTEAPSTVNADYVQLSATTPLQPKQKIANLFQLNQTRPFILQRLTDQTYFFQRQEYATTFYVGKHGVLVFDPLENGGEQLLTAIRQVTTLPIVAMVYSHAHYDHIGDAKLFVSDAKKSGVPLRIIASSATASKLASYHSQLPKPNEIIAWPNGKFTFEQLTVQLHGFRHAAHADDHAAWLLVQEKVLHAADQMNPDQLPFWNFGGSENYLYYPSNLHESYNLNWDYINAGHGNVGSRDDFNFYFRFLKDLEQATAKSIKTTPWGINVDTAKVNNHAAYMVEWRKAVAQKTTAALRPDYGQYYGFEYSVPSNADMVALKVSEYR